jgi:hypothetical protein
MNGRNGGVVYAVQTAVNGGSEQLIFGQRKRLDARMRPACGGPGTPSPRILDEQLRVRDEGGRLSFLEPVVPIGNVCQRWQRFSPPPSVLLGG